MLVRIKKKMKKLLLKFAVVFITLAFSGNLIAQQLAPLAHQPRAALISAEVLSRYHYKKNLLDDATSAKIFDNYWKSLDGEKIFFLQADIDRFSSAQTKLDDAIRNENLLIPFAIYNLYQQRIAERINYSRALLKNGFTFEAKEAHEFSRKKASWANTSEELNELWRKRVKNDWLRLKLAGKDDKSIVETLNKRFDNILKSVSKVNSDDVFQYFMNAYVMTIDPHTNYLGKRAAEDFDISMRLSLFGIGAVLQDKDEYTTIRELIPGGPAALSGKLKVGDRIVGVGQVENAPVTDVMGWRIDDAVALIRGAENSVVVLDVLPVEAGPDGKHKLISLTRKKISLDKQAAKKSIIEVKENNLTRRIGVISLPGFYQDFAARQKGDKEFKSATRDVARLLEELKAAKVEGVLIDLRNNGGGALSEAIELTGLFIDKGPVVQQRDAKGVVSVESDTHPGVVWDGPLGVLINRGSASASEIFAAAIQDYARGIVIGETSFGKGTVQSVISLDQLMNKNSAELGDLKMTIAQFFRINGGTTQLRGVSPDIGLPSLNEEVDFGESSYENALPWTQIKPAKYMPSAYLSGVLPVLKSNHEARIANNKEFQYLREDIAEFSRQRKQNQISLNEAERRKEREIQEARIKSREKEKAGSKAGNSKSENSVENNAAQQDDGLQSNERNLDTDLALEKAKTNAKDIYLDEAAHILSDAVSLVQISGKVTASSLNIQVRN